MISDLPPGEKIKLHELKCMVQDDDAYKNLTEEDQTRLKAELQKHRELKRKGVRPSNLSASQDIRRTIERVSDEVSDGLHSVLFNVLTENVSLIICLSELAYMPSSSLPGVMWTTRRSQRGSEQQKPTSSSVTC